MRYVLAVIISVSAWAQVQNIPNTTFPATRQLINSNFSYLDANKAGTGSCATGTYAVRTMTTGVSCLAVDWSVVTGKPTTFTPSAHNHTATDINSGVFGYSRLGSGGDGSGAHVLYDNGAWGVPTGGGGGGGFYQTVQANGVSATQRAVLNLINGTNITVSCSDLTSITTCSFSLSGTISATNATNIAGGLAGQFPYQSAPNVTGFRTPNLPNGPLVLDASGNAAVPGMVSGDPTKNGTTFFQGATDGGGVAFTIANIGGAAVTVVWPSDTSTTPNGGVLTIGAGMPCPSLLPPWAPQSCRSSSWGPGGGGSIQVNGTTITSVNLNSSSPAPDANYTALPLKTSGNNAIVQMPITFAVGANTCQYWIAPPADWSASGSTGQCAIDAAYLYTYVGSRWQRTAWDTGWGTNTVARPNFDFGTGTYNNDVTVTITESTPSPVAICYTTDGSTPGAATPGTCDSSPTQTYSTSLTISSTGSTLKALGTKSTYTNSIVQSATYTLQVGTPTASPANGSTVSAGSTATWSSVTSSGVTFHYTSDGSTPTCSTGSTGNATIPSGSSVTYKVMGCKTNYADSTVLTVTYTIGSGPTVGNTYENYVSAVGASFTRTGVTWAAGSSVFVYFGFAQTCDASTYTVSAGGQTFTQIGALSNQAFSCGGAYQLTNANALTTGSVTIAGSGTGIPGAMVIGIIEVRNVGTTPSVTGVQGHTEAGTSIAASSALTASGSGVVVVGVINYYPGGTYTAGSGYTIPTSGTATGSLGTGAIEYQVVSAGSYIPSMTITGGSGMYSTIFAVLFQ